MNAGARVAPASARADAPGWRTLYPFRSHYLALGPHRLHYLDEGPRDAPALLLVHGNPTWSFYWREAVLALRDRFRVVVPDHLGCGLSDKPQRWEYRLAGHVANLERLALELELAGVTLGVHDWGGAIGLGFATRHPGRVARLVITNTAAFPAARLPLRIAASRLPLLGPLVVRGLNGFARAALSMASARGVAGPAAEGLLAPYRSWRERVAILRFVQDIPMGPRHPSWAELLRIDVGLQALRDKPALILWGERDFVFTPAFRQEWQRRFPGAAVQAFPGAGHYLMEDEPQAVVAALARFLEPPAA